MADESSTPLVLPYEFTNCFHNGQLDLRKFQTHLQLKRKRDEEEQETINHAINSRSTIETSTPPRNPKRKRSAKRHFQVAELHDGTSFYVTPTNSLWYALYIRKVPTSKKEKKLFRQRFRMPYSSFQLILETIKNHSLFEKWTKSDAVGDSSVPM